MGPHKATFHLLSLKEPWRVKCGLEGVFGPDVWLSSSSAKPSVTIPSPLPIAVLPSGRVKTEKP